MPIAYVDPRSRLTYASFLLRGLVDTGHTVKWRKVVGFEFPRNGAACVVDDRRIWFDPRDPVEVNDQGFEWADVYGAVNVAEDEHRPIVALGPLFGFTMWPAGRCYLEWPRLVAAGGPVLRTLQLLRYQVKTRRPLGDYRPGDSDAGYLFARSRQWVKHPEANAARGRFAEAAEGLVVDLDIGLSSGQRIGLDEYLQRTRRSACVFNSPAVHGCLGWKLGEHLALGKAIVSIPFGRRLPAPLEHGEHVHYVADDVGSIRAGIAAIVADRGYRQHLERGARSWYEREMAPSRVVSRLLSADEEPIDRGP